MALLIFMGAYTNTQPKKKNLYFMSYGKQAWATEDTELKAATME